jgi:hypothetical protein
MGGECKGFELLVAGLMEDLESVFELRDRVVFAADGLATLDEVREFVV